MPSTHSHPCSWKEFTFANELTFSLLLKNREKWTGDPGTEPIFFPYINRAPQSAGLTGSHFSILNHKYQFLCSTCSAILPPFLCLWRFRNHDAGDHISSWFLVPLVLFPDTHRSNYESISLLDPYLVRAQVLLSQVLLLLGCFFPLKSLCFELMIKFL